MTDRKTAFARTMLQTAFEDATTALNDIEDLCGHASLPLECALDTHMQAARDALNAARDLVKRLQEGT